ncbi:homoserine O-acetyltransferase [Chishuiella changwenlii]|uniref:Homoserine O-acetyltransferase n=1 Tax=Chishuiella changwenlii TaxID=1434701 RepID=A0A1M7CA07_9FLAO|nr:homoserine O-acetyltransferase [Chishuiella changwenlii]GGF06643.1 homoserine O-acetyltransferase [Chishuiella changwenlii]SHL64027.1 homoserine O-acetyltransferase [Chishuiella changwenlii]
MNLHQFNYPKPFELENGKTLEKLTITYHTAGKLNEQKDNVIWVCHALTANSDVFDWWKGLFGEDDLFNPKDHFIICANVIGSHYGTTNPLSINPKTNTPYFSDFPTVTIKDMANAHQLLAESLGINQIKILIGGSLGGQQALEFTLLNQTKIENLVLLATNAVHSPWGIAFNETQRLAIEADESFYANKENRGQNGLIAARTIAMLSYRTYEIYEEKQKDLNNVYESFKASSYQKYQGQKLANRFNAYSYWLLTKTMDSQNIARNRACLEETLNSIKAKTKVIAISSDILFPAKEQKFIADHIPNASYHEINSSYGHDGFLVELDALKEILKDLA